ncbi:MAG: methyl-accepting chemotaxis protein [Planctomycetes bacterium]|jgi:methyl-accepting chemotaxis protein|nr:methyl-accepting chemotaxis protein [Planctomycetota bacterium]
MSASSNLKISQKLMLTMLMVSLLLGLLPVAAGTLACAAFGAPPSALYAVLWGSLAAGLLLAFLPVHWLISQGFLKDLERLSRWTGKVGKGAYEDPPGLDRGDELGSLSREFRTVYQSLVGEIQRSKVLLTNLRDTIQKITTYSTEVLSISNDQASGANQQATAVQEASTTSKEIAVTAKEITSTALSVLEMAEKASQACGKGMETVERAIEGMKDLQRQVQSVAMRMVELGENSQKIGDVLAIIEEISDRTNLLSLNAAIEAASAGEAGKRFGVVASEIRSLAERTGEQTKDIKSIIEKIQTSTNNTIMVTEQGMKAVQTSFDLVNQVGEAFNHIEGQVNETMRAAKEITFSTQQQTSACEQMAVTIAEVSQVAEHFVKGTEDTSNALAELNNLSERLSALCRETPGAGEPGRREAGEPAASRA